MPMSSDFFEVRNISKAGRRATLSFSFTSASSGDAVSRRRMNKPMSTRTAETRKGIRQPEDTNWSFGMSGTSKNTRLEGTDRAGTPDGGELPSQAWLRGG